MILFVLLLGGFFALLAAGGAIVLLMVVAAIVVVIALFNGYYAAHKWYRPDWDGKHPRLHTWGQWLSENAAQILAGTMVAGIVGTVAFALFMDFVWSNI